MALVWRLRQVMASVESGVEPSGQAHGEIWLDTSFCAVHQRLLVELPTSQGRDDGCVVHALACTPSDLWAHTPSVMEATDGKQGAAAEEAANGAAHRVLPPIEGGSTWSRYAVACENLTAL